jgi:hypothetical protein
VEITYNRFWILIFVLLILTSFCPVYFQRDGMGNVSAVSLNMILGNSESAGPEEFMLDPPGQSKGISPVPLGNQIHLEVYPFRSIFSYLFHAPVFGLKTAILRC